MATTPLDPLRHSAGLPLWLGAVGLFATANLMVLMVCQVAYWDDVARLTNAVSVTAVVPRSGGLHCLIAALEANAVAAVAVGLFLFVRSLEHSRRARLGLPWHVPEDRVFTPSGFGVVIRRNATASRRRTVRFDPRIAAIRPHVRTARRL